MGPGQLERLQGLKKYGLTQLYLPQWLPSASDPVEVEVGEIKPHFPRLKIRLGRMTYQAGDVSPLDRRYLRMHRTSREVEGVSLVVFEFEPTTYPFQFSLNADLRHYRDPEKRNYFLADLRADHGFPLDEFLKVVDSLQPFPLQT